MCVRIRSYIGCRPTLLQEQNTLTIENLTIRIFFLNVDSPFFFFFFTIKFFGRRLSFHRAAFECSPLLNDAAGAGAATRSGLLFKTLKISRCVLFFFFFTPSRILPPPPASTVFIVVLDTELLIRRVPFPVQKRFDQIQRLLQATTSGNFPSARFLLRAVGCKQFTSFPSCRTPWLHLKKMPLRYA
jgi:hypothetical protein